MEIKDLYVIKNFMPYGYSHVVRGELMSPDPGISTWNWGALPSGDGRGSGLVSVNWYTLPQGNQTFWNPIIHAAEKEIRNHINDETVRVVQARAVGMTAGMYGGKHVDEMSTLPCWIVLYYPQTIRDIDGGRTMVYDQQGNILLNQTPEENTCIIFKGDLVHEITPLTPHFYNQLRISINLKLSVNDEKEIKPDGREYD